VRQNDSNCLKFGGCSSGSNVRTTARAGPQQIPKKVTDEKAGWTGNNTKGKNTFADVKQID